MIGNIASIDSMTLCGSGSILRLCVCVLRSHEWYESSTPKKKGWVFCKRSAAHPRGAERLELGANWSSGKPSPLPLTNTNVTSSGGRGEITRGNLVSARRLAKLPFPRGWRRRGEARVSLSVRDVLVVKSATSFRHRCWSTINLVCHAPNMDIGPLAMEVKTGSEALSVISTLKNHSSVSLVISYETSSREDFSELFPHSRRKLSWRRFPVACFDDLCERGSGSSATVTLVKRLTNPEPLWRTALTT